MGKQHKKGIRQKAVRRAPRSRPTCVPLEDAARLLGVSRRKLASLMYFHHERAVHIDRQKLVSTSFIQEMAHKLR